MYVQEISKKLGCGETDVILFRQETRPLIRNHANEFVR
jgi:hypothetical protein